MTSTAIGNFADTQIGALTTTQVQALGATNFSALFGYLAGKTSHIRFATYVLVLGYHPPLAIAKRYGTLDRVSNGRLVLGVGKGRRL